MNINLNLPSDLENELSIEASQLKLSLTEYILSILSVRPSPQNLPKTGAELVDYWKSAGVIDSRSDDDTPDEIAIEGIRQGLKEAISGQTIPLTQMWEGIDVD